MRDLAKLCPLLLTICAACGGDSNKLPDGPPGGPDAMRDPDASPALTATVRIRQENFEASPGTPIEGASVAAIAPGGAQVIYATDANGSTTFPVEAGTTVWAAVPPGGPPAILPGGSVSGHLYLIVDVSPGDTIELGAAPPGTGSAAGTLTINYTPYAGGIYASFHDALMNGTSCYDYGTETVPGTIVFTTYAGCGAPARDLVITSYDPSSGTPVAWLTVPNVSSTPGTIDATAGTWDSIGTDYVVNHTGHDASVYYASTTVVSPSSWHATFLGGPLDTGAGTYNQVDATLSTPVFATQLRQNSALYQFIIEPLATIPASYDVDGGNLLPFIQEASYDTTGRRIHWLTALPGTVAPQIVTSTFSFFDSLDSSQYRWTIYAPGTTTELVIPDVPDELTTHDLHDGDFIYPDIWLINAEGSSYSDLLTDIDLYRDDPAGSGFRPTTKNLLSGGYGIDK